MCPWIKTSSEPVEIPFTVSLLFLSVDIAPSFSKSKVYYKNIFVYTHHAFFSKYVYQPDKEYFFFFSYYFTEKQLLKFY